METTQKALLVITRPGESHGLDELNIALNRGWRVAHATAMGGASAGFQDGASELCFAALVIIERHAESGAGQADHLEETYSDLLDNLVDEPGGVVASRHDVAAEN